MVRKSSIPASLQDLANSFGPPAQLLLLRTKDMCPLELEDFRARVLSTQRPSLLAFLPSHSLAGLALPSLCTTYGPVVHFLAVSLLTLPVSRPQRNSSDLGGTASFLQRHVVCPVSRAAQLAGTDLDMARSSSPTVRARNHSDVILPARKIEFESCK